MTVQAILFSHGLGSQSMYGLVYKDNALEITIHGNHAPTVQI